MRCTFLTLTTLLLLASPSAAQQDLLEKLRSEKNDSLRCELLFGLVVHYLNRDLDSLLLVADELEITADRSNSVKFKVSALNAKGLAHKNLGDFEKAVDFYLRALKENEKIKDKVKQAKIYLNLADLLRIQKQFDKSLSYQNLGLEISKELADSSLIAKFSTNIGLVYKDKNEIDSAYFWYSKANEIASRTEALAMDAITIKINLSGIEHKRKNYLEMVRLAKEALEASRKTGDNDQISLSATNVGLGLKELGRPVEAIPFYLEAESAAKAFKNPETQIMVLGNLVEAYRASGQFELALDKTLNYIELKDSLQKSVFKNSIAEMQTKYETREKDLQIERQQGRQRLILFIGLGLVLALLGLFLFFQNRQNHKQRETELAAQLEHAEAEKLREMDAMKSTFFANISHEFRTPLTLIVSPLEQMIGGSFKGDFQKYYRIMHRNGKRLLDLVNQLLDLSRLESGKLKLQVAEGDLNGFVRAVAYSFESLAMRKQIDYQVIVEDVPSTCFFDKDKVEKILSNLISNAFKFTNDGKQIVVSSSIAEGKAQFKVIDQGMGIPADQLLHIFERFAKTVTSELQPGSGIGLALTKELVELQKGEIKVESKEGEGTIFTVTLPVDKNAFQSDEIGMASELPNFQNLSNLNPEIKITEKAAVDSLSEFQSAIRNPQSPILLVVEDNPDVRNYIVDQFKGQYQIIEAENGRIGLKLALETTPDLVISDIMMPEMDGTEFCKLLKTNEKTSHIPVVMLTALAEQGDRIKGLELGADDYLVKPFDAKELTVRVANLVAGRQKLQEHYRRSLNSFAPIAEVKAESVDAVFLKKVREAVEANLEDDNFSVVELSGQVGMSRSQLHRKLSALTGFSPNEVIRNMRLERAKQLLEKRAGNASEVAYLTGFNSPAYFAKCFKDYFGMTPSEVLG